MLQAILDKLQKKDIYGVFAEPVDPEELLDYHEIIEHPMDFGTIRKKLSTGGYANLEQFESDVFLICTNAMEYNAPDTIYFRQARSIQEQARKKFQNIRFESDDALKSEQNTQSNSVTKEPIKSFLCKVAPHLAGSHIPSAATLNSTGDACTGLDAVQAGPSELPVVELMDGSLTCENKSDKGEEKSVKSSPIKLGRKPIMLDEDHRTTYNASIEQPDILSDSAFSTFENEQKHLVAVGLDAEYSYARSLARFAATLGPIAWRIASEKIEKALPTGVKFGPGWVGEYEPLPTPILFFESHSQQQSDHNTQIQPKGGNWRDRTKDERKCTQSAASRTVQLCRPRVPPDSLTIGVMDGKANHLKELSVCSEPLEKRPRFFGFKAGSQHITSNAMSLQHNSLAMTSANEYGNTKVLANVSGKTILQNSPGMMSTVVDIAARRLEKRPEVANLVSQELISSSKDNIQPEVLKLPDMVAYCPESASSCTETRGMPNGKGVESLVWSSRPSPSLGFITPKQIRAGTDCLNQGGHVQAIDDPVELLRLMSGWVPSKVISSNSLLTDNQKQVMTSVSSPRSNSSAAASAAACAWMSVGRSSEHKSMEPSNLIRMQAGAASPGNLTSEYLVSTSRILEDGKKRPMPPVSSLPIQAAAEESFVQNNGLTGFPQLIMAQLSRFHGQTPWRGLLPHVQQKQKKDMQPPDLNISFHSPGSPIKQSGVLVDSQQPDLALQL